MTDKEKVLPLIQALSEARAALYGAREALGDIANISYAIELADKVLAQLQEKP